MLKCHQICSVLFCETKPDLTHFLSDLEYCLPMVYHSSENVLHNREKPFFLFDTGHLLHQLKYLDVL